MKRRVVNRIVFSRLGRSVFPQVAPLLRRGYNIILNNDLTPAINGENWLVDQFPESGTFVDVGFHRGHWTDYVLQRRPGAIIYAFDPWPDAAGYHAGFSWSSRVPFFPLGLADKEGTMTFYDYENACNSLALREAELGLPTNRYDVEVTTLDSWCAEQHVEHIDLLKLDVEGFDLNVLQGAERLLRQQAISAFVFEYSSSWIGSRKLLADACSYIEDVGYELFKLFNGFVVPFVYDVRHETFAGAMFVGLARNSRDRLPVRTFELDKPTYPSR